MDLLLSAAQTWRVLLDSEYNLIYGKKKKLYTVRLVFSPEDFYHNAGFQHLDDITFSHITSHPKTLDSVLSGTITQEMIQKSQNYLSFVEPRLKAIVYLQNLLESDFRTYMFNARKLPFYTRYRQNTLLSEHPPISFFFLPMRMPTMVITSRARYLCRTYETTQ